MSDYKGFNAFKRLFKRKDMFNGTISRREYAWNVLWVILFIILGFSVWFSVLLSLGEGLGSLSGFTARACMVFIELSVAFIVKFCVNASLP